MTFGGGLGNGCLTGARFTMSATLLHRGDPSGPEIDLDSYGEWTNSQDPLTGQIVKIWVPFEDSDTTPDVDESVTLGTIPCLARGVVDGGIRVAGTTEWFGDEYRNIEFVKLWTPPHIIVTKRDRVTNIRDKSGRIRWVDEEFIDPRDPTETRQPRATVFNVNGVTPLYNAYNDLVEWYIMCERAAVPDGND